MKKSYVMIHVIKHDMDPNMDLNYSRKIGPASALAKSRSKFKVIHKWNLGICETGVHGHFYHSIIVKKIKKAIKYVFGLIQLVKVNLEAHVYF